MDARRWWRCRAPSAVLAGLALAGLPSDRFLFAGFLSHRAGERANVLEELKGVRATLIFFESAQRLADSLAAMAQVLGDRPAAMARELTKLHEEVRRGSLANWRRIMKRPDPHGARSPSWWRRRCKAAPDTAKIDAALRAALPFMPVKAAADLIAGLTDAPRKQVYARALELKDELKDGE